MLIAEPLELAQRLIDRIRPALMSNLIDDTLRRVIATEITAMLAEHVRALLADDEATIEVIADAFCREALDRSMSDLRDGERDMAIAGGRTVLAALHRKALGE
jgi:hypothetical protein